MVDQPVDDLPDGGAWTRLTGNRPWYRKLSSHRLAEARIDSPDGATYLVRVLRNSPVSGPDGGRNSDPLSTLFGLVSANVAASGETGWRIEVLLPAVGWRDEKVLYTQQVGARAIVADVAVAISDALERGEKLWS